eukprot:gene9790-9948_t
MMKTAMDRVALSHMDDPNLPEIERQRLANMQRNKMMVDQLLAGTDTSLLKKPAQEPKRQSTKPRKPKETFQPSRKSDRNAGRERPDYRGQQELAIYVERQPRQPKLRERKVGAGRSGGGSRGAWHDSIPAPPDAARHKALAAAEDAVAAIEKEKKHKAYLKVLGPSMVSSGFWLQAPIELLDHFHQDLDVTFTCDDETRPAETFKHTQARRQEGDLCDDAWTVGFLLKKDKKSGEHKGGVGFSKNWRGFAIDQVWMLWQPWAWDYASSPPENLDKVRFKYLGCAEEQDADSDKSCSSHAAAEDADDERADGEGADQHVPAPAADAAAAALHSKGRGRGGSPKRKKAAEPEPEAGQGEEGEEGDFVVDWILDTSLTAEGVRIYLVRWLGYPPEADSWEPADSFDRPVRSYDWEVPIPAEVP